MLLGVDIENPNKTKMAANISLEITLTDASNNIVDVINDTLYCIDADTIFHYGNQKVWMRGNVARISASAYAKEFIDTDGKNLWMVRSLQILLCNMETVIVL